MYRIRLMYRADPLIIMYGIGLYRADPLIVMYGIVIGLDALILMYWIGFRFLHIVKQK